MTGYVIVVAAVAPLCVHNRRPSSKPENSVGETSAAFSKPERPRGTLRADNQGSVPGSTDPFRVAEGDAGVRGTLPPGTESPRARQPPHCS